MINKFLPPYRRNKDEGEKPFWISFADLMTALMVMFLLVMSVALLAVTDEVSSADKSKAKREQEIDQLLAKIEQAAKKYPGIQVDKNRAVIDFGDRARFDTGSSRLSTTQAEYLSEFVSEMLVIAKGELGNKWLKRIVSEGYADERGDYLLNLNLSLQRSQRVLCALLAPPPDQRFTLTPPEKELVRDYFLVGGYSYNSQKKSLEESRRIELRLEFFALDEAHPVLNEISRGYFGTCRI
jgi:outer membrane protein OmpA-like peptidoglycan-associated protein